MSVTTTTRLPLASLELAPENARYGQEHDADALAQLAVSITAVGLLDPLKVYQVGDTYRVWDGGRRLAALQRMVALPAHLADGIPVIVTDAATADLASLATFIREDMHPAEKFLAWNAQFDAGHSEDMIAAACGVSRREVAQLLRFRTLAPEVLEAFRAGRMDFDAALAFTLTTDHEAQRSLLDSFGEGQADPWAIRDALRRGSVRATDKRAGVVGREAYEAAGGRFLSDLFSDREVDETWQDVALLQRLYDARLAEEVEKIGAEGWGDVIVNEEPWGWQNGLHRMDPEGEDGGWTADQLADGVAVLVVGYSGQLEVKRGLRRSQAAINAKAANASPAKVKPALYGFGHKGHETMTRVATAATQAAVAARPDLAYDALVAQIAWSGCAPYGSQQQGASKLGISYADRPKALAGEVREALEAWAKRLPTNNRVAFVQAVADLSAEEKAQLLALGFAASLSAVEEKVAEQANEARQEIGWLARRAGVDFAAVWTPDAEFLKSASRDALLAAVKELAPRELDRWTGAKKGALVEFVAQKAEQAAWTPEFLRQLVAEPEAAKPARKGKKARANDDEAPADEAA